MDIMVGRTALNYWEERETNFEKTDLDIWTNDEDQFYLHKGTKGFDCALIPDEIMDCFSEYSKCIGTATLEDLLAIKLSHLPYDNHFWKHAQDYLLISKLTQGKYNTKLYEVLKPFWVSKFGNKAFLNLDRKKDQFFDDFVPKQHDHDELHVLVAKDGIPLYTLCLKANKEVMIDIDKFKSLSYDQQIRMMKEEVAVIALERYLIPGLTNKKLPSIMLTQAWNKALHKTITRLTKGSYSEFMCIFLREMLSPLEEEMLFALSKLNLKEKYMSNTVLTFQEIKDLYDERGGDYFTDFLLDYSAEVKGFEFIQQEGGGEGGAEDCEAVIKVDGQLYKITFNYYSHLGYDFAYADARQVKPVERTVTFYE